MIVGVTGATGYIGYSICVELLKQNYEVIALIYDEKPEIAELPIKKIKGNILDSSTLIPFVEQCEVIIHAAGIIKLCYGFDQQLYDINVKGTFNLLEMAQKANVRRVLYLSSIHVYKQHPYHEELNEKREFVFQNSVYYDQTKKEGHELCIKLAKEGKLETVVLCPTSVIGPPDFLPSKAGKGILDIANGKVPAVVKGGFNFVDVRDVAQAVVSAISLGRSGETYILGGEYATIKQMADLVLEAKGKKKRLRTVPIALAYLGVPLVKMYAKLTKTEPIYDKLYLDILNDGNTQISSEKSKKELNFNPRPLKTTIFDAINWFMDN
ncbi:MAG: NAD-dependent epimerase/dehydratase family protein [Brumimicrobium sp.]|nr:NAD-dependent epimerase/dehydratase family protein [Brumimicrobium sp.]MCO5269442.1 NAD-dependent epimerase/dehydratase family protein [Brumimicrobium sp.]